jgi:hypothetical protein
MQAYLKYLTVKQYVLELQNYLIETFCIFPDTLSMGHNCNRKQSIKIESPIGGNSFAHLEQ